MVKLFRSKCCKELELEINKWEKENPVEIKNTSITVKHNGYIVMSVVYNTISYQ